jgi:hypothetical protein
MGMPKFVDLCPLIQVYDMLESVLFYTSCLGFKVKMQAPMLSEPYPHFNWCLLKRGDVELMLNTAYEGAERPATRDLTRHAAHADTTLYFSAKDIDKAYRELRAHKIAVGEPVVSHGMKTIGCSDPDGYAICIQWPDSALNG